MLAIVLPYYKFTFFEETLQSLASQTDKRFKVYIGDDASIENPNVLLAKFQRKFDFVYHRFETNLGGTSLTQQWERCIALSEKEHWLMILGDDDVLGKNVVAEFYKNLPEIEEIGSNVVRFTTQVIDGDGKAISGFFEHPKLEKATDSFWRKFKGETRSSLSEYFFRKSKVEKKGFRNLPLAWYSDDLAILEFSEFGLIYSITEEMIFIRYTDLSLSGNEFNKESKDLAKFKFFSIMYFEFKHFFEKQDWMFLREKLVNSFMNRIKIRNYFNVCFLSCQNIDLYVFFLINKRIANYMKVRLIK